VVPTVLDGLVDALSASCIKASVLPRKARRLKIVRLNNTWVDTATAVLWQLSYDRVP